MVNITFYNETFMDFYKVNARINCAFLLIVQDKHLLDWSNFGLPKFKYVLKKKKSC